MLTAHRRIRSADEIAEGPLRLTGGDAAEAERLEQVAEFISELRENNRRTPWEEAREEAKIILGQLMRSMLGDAELVLITESGRILGTLPEPSEGATYEFRVHDLKLSANSVEYVDQLLGASLRILAAKILGVDPPGDEIPSPEFLATRAHLVARAEAVGAPVSRYETFDTERWGLSANAVMGAIAP